MSSVRDLNLDDCAYLERDLDAFREENSRLIEQRSILENEFNLLEQRISELEAEALMQTQIEQNDLSVQKQFSTLFDASPAALLLIDHHGKIEMLNGAASEMLQQDREQLIGHNLRKFMKRESSLALLQLLQASEHSLSPVHSEKIFALKNEVLFSLNFVRLRDQGQFAGFFLLSPTLVALDQVSGQSLRLASSIIEQIREGLMVTDAKGRVVRVNQAFSEITGYSDAEVLGKTPQLLHSGRHSAEFYQKMWQQIQHHGWWAGEIWNKRKTGEVFPEWLQISRIYDQQTAQTFFVATFSDITDRKAHQNQLDRLAFYDALTGLPNRSMLMQFLDAQLSRLQADSQNNMAVLFLDLDKFKEVNDHYGHAEGDRVLREATQRIIARIRESDIASRIGGDEFVLVLSRIKDESDAINVVNDLIEALSDPFVTDKSTHYLSASIGLVMAPRHGDNVEDLMRRADAAMYRAKNLGRNTYQIFSEEDEHRIIESNQMIKHLWQAIGDPVNWIEMHYQPIYQLGDRQNPTHYEALIRLRSNSGELIYPDLFIELAEQNGVINALGYAIFEVICHDMKTRQLPDAIKIAVNLSPIQFRQEDFIERLQAIADQHQLRFSNFHFEVTETATMQNVGWISDVLEVLKARGAHVMLDDFGTGFASLSILKNLPVDILKIDRSFVQELTHSDETQTLVKAMVAMAKALSLKIVVEGVETQEQYDWLATQEVDYFQGYLLGRPQAEFVSGVS